MASKIRWKQGDYVKLGKAVAEFNKKINKLNAEENKFLGLAAGNIPSVKLLLPSNLNVKDLLEADFVVMTEKAVNEVTERLQ